MKSITLYTVFAWLLMLNRQGFGLRKNHRFLHDDEQYPMARRGYDMYCSQCYNSAYIKDTFNVYFMGQKIKDASAMSFQILTYGYAKDNWNVYYMGQKINGASKLGFEVLRDGYAKDSFSVYYAGKVIKDASTLSFEVIGNGYAKDSWNVYFRGQKMQGASPSSFKMNTFRRRHQHE